MVRMKHLFFDLLKRNCTFVGTLALEGGYMGNMGGREGRGEGHGQFPVGLQSSHLVV